MSRTSKNLTITKAAELLGVCRSHLSLVLNGHRKSRRLTRRYRELKCQQQAPAASAPAPSPA